MTAAAVSAYQNVLPGPPAERGAMLAKLVLDRAFRTRDSVLCLGRAQFNTDLAELRRTAERFQWLDLPTHILDAYHQDMLPPEVRFQAKYHLFAGPKYDASWAAAEAFGIALLQDIAAALPLKAVMAANFDYWPDQCLRLACARLGIPFVVLSREHFTLAAHMDYYRDYTLTPYVDAIGVAGAVDVDALVRHNTIPRDKIHITGLPRLDPWRHTLDKPWPQMRPLIVLLPYGDEGYLAPNNWQTMLRIFDAMSKECRRYGTRFVIKCKENTDEKSLQNLSRDLKHATVISDVPLSHVLPYARIVVGYNSMGLQEALLSPARIVIPQWADALRAADEQIFAPGTDEVTFARTPAEMENEILMAHEKEYWADRKARLRLFRASTDLDERASAGDKVVRMIEGVCR